MSTVSGQQLRKVMRCLPSPVTIVTSAVDGEIRGITIGSFTSTSLEPALVSFNVAKESPMLELLGRSGRFVVHFLRDTQHDLSEHFAIPERAGAEQFASVDYDTTREGLPLLAGVLARLTCSVHAAHDAGDHAIVVGAVTETEVLESGRPLVYYDRAYRSVDPGSVAVKSSSSGTSTP